MPGAGAAVPVLVRVLLLYLSYIVLLDSVLEGDGKRNDKTVIS